MFTGMQSLCFAQQTTSLCVNVPETFPIFVWPVSSRSSDGYNYCLSHAIFFSRCPITTSIYQFSLNTDTNQLCLQMDSDLSEDALVKVYFIKDTSPCTSPQLCFITSIIASHWIRQKCKI